MKHKFNLVFLFKEKKQLKCTGICSDPMKT